jgi:hypothetical protein
MITAEADAPEIESLGTVFYEPLWLFHRSDLKTRGLEGLRGRKISIGLEGGASPERFTSNCSSEAVSIARTCNCLDILHKMPGTSS